MLKTLKQKNTTAPLPSDSSVAGHERTGSPSMLACALILIAAVWITFGRLLYADFVFWDDQLNVFENQYLYRITPANLGHFWTRGFEGLYVPLSYMLFALVASIARMSHQDASITSMDTLLNPRAFHAANLVLHTLNVLLVFALLRTIIGRTASGRGRANAPALIGALLFAVHPLQVESVAWITELRGLLSEFFSLAAINAYMASVAASVGSDPTSARGAALGRAPGVPSVIASDPSDLSDTPGPPIRRPAYWLAMLFYLLALFSKPSAAALPIALLVFDPAVARRPLRSVLASVVPWVLVALPFVYVTRQVQTLAPQVDTAWWTRPFIACDAIAFYLCKLFAPIGLTIDYGRRPSVVLAHWWGYADWLLPLLAGTILYRLRREYPLAAAGGMLSVAMLLPLLGLVPFNFQFYSTVADRYAYLAMIGPALIVAAVLAQMTRRVAAAYTIAVLALVALAGASALQCRNWMNTDALFSNAVRMYPDSYRMLDAYGFALIGEGRPRDAIVPLTKAIRINPTDADSYTNLARAYHLLGRLDDARDALLTSISVDPHDQQTYLDLGLLYLEQGRAAAGADQIRHALQLKPKYPRAETAYGNALLMLGRAGDAVSEFQATLALDPNQHDALAGLGSALVQVGQIAEAETAFQSAVRIDPRDESSYANLAACLVQTGQTDAGITEYRRAIALDANQEATHFNLACAFMQNRDALDAIPEFREAVRINPRSSQDHDELGVAYVVTGQRDSARVEFEIAIKLDPASQSARRHLSMLGSDAGHRAGV